MLNRVTAGVVPPPGVRDDVARLLLRVHGRSAQTKNESWDEVYRKISLGLLTPAQLRSLGFQTHEIRTVLAAASPGPEVTATASGGNASPREPIGKTSPLYKLRFGDRDRNIAVAKVSMARRALALGSPSSSASLTKSEPRPAWDAAGSRRSSVNSTVGTHGGVNSTVHNSGGVTHLGAKRLQFAPPSPVSAAPKTTAGRTPMKPSRPGSAATAAGPATLSSR